MAMCSHRCERRGGTNEYNAKHGRGVPKPLVPAQQCRVHRMTPPGMRGLFSKIVAALVAADAAWVEDLSAATIAAMLDEDDDSRSVMDEDSGAAALTAWRYTKPSLRPQFLPPNVAPPID